MSKLIVPSYLKGKIEDKKEQNKQPALDKVPKAVGWRITVLPHKGIDKTKGGLLLTDKAIEEQQLTTNVGLILSMGSDAYADKNKFPMPFIISSNKADDIIERGMFSKKFEITFPLPMYLIMKGLQTLPNFISNYISSLVKKGTDKI